MMHIDIGVNFFPHIILTILCLIFFVTDKNKIVTTVSNITFISRYEPGCIDNPMAFTIF